MKKVISIFGTRPEAIKMAPVVRALEAHPAVESRVIVTAQHREMLDQVLALFGITPDHDLDIMKSGQTLDEITSRVLTGLTPILKEEQPDMILVHGDTTTTFSAGLAAFYLGIPVGHVEAGLRSHDLWRPFPEEANRSLTGRLASLHFAPTEGNVANLLAENIPAEWIHKTGNTVIDALLSVVEGDYRFDREELERIPFGDKRVVLLTAHRRENLGEPMHAIFRAVRRLVEELEDVAVVFPMHLNPKVREIAREHLSGHPDLYLVEPLDYAPFANLMARCHLVLTDSGGIQEEAPALGKPVLVLRTETERPEAVEAGTVLMAGVEEERIYTLGHRLLTDGAAYAAMASAVNPYGDGRAAERIARLIGGDL